MIKAGLFLKDYTILKHDKCIENPIISVILPTYCRGNNGLLERAINSVLNQTFKEIELIIVDDGSVDKTQEIVKKFISTDNRVIYIRNEVNSGLPALRVNQGVLNSRGKYIAYQFDDDYWDSNALSNLYEEIKKHKEECLVYGKCKYTDVMSGANYLLSHEFRYYELMECNFIANNSVIHHKSLYNKYGAYDCHLCMRRLCDWDLWLRWSKEVPFIFTNKVISYVEGNVEDSLGKTCAYDLNIFRVFTSINRNERLALNNFSNYYIDDIEFIENEKNKNLIFNKHVLPWYLKNLELISDKDCYSIPTKKQTILVTKGTFDSTIDITITNFIKLLGNKYRMIYIPENQLNEESLNLVDFVVLFRTCGNKSTELLKKCVNKPILYFIDDDLLNFYKLSDVYNYLAPGTEMYNNLVYQIRNSDLVISYSKTITESVKNYNDKILQLKTNVLSKYVNINKAENKKFKIAFIGGSARKDEIDFYWQDIVNISNKYKDKIELYFWGYIPERISEIKYSKVNTSEFTTSYYEYLNRLHSEKFDIVLSPFLFDDKIKRAKSPIKFLEAVISNAIGIYSDVIPYSFIKDDFNGLKIENKSGEIEKKIDYIINLSQDKRDKIVSNARELVLRNFTTESQSDMFENAIEVAKLQHYIGKNGKICYVIHSGYLGGAENHILRHAILAKENKFNVIVCIPSVFNGMNEKVENVCKLNEIEVHYLDFITYIDTKSINKIDCEYLSNNFIKLIEKENIKLVHSTTLNPALQIAAAKNNIPHIASVYAVETNDINEKEKDILPKYIHSDSILYANIWAEGINAYSRCIRSWIPEKFFNYNETKLKRKNEIHIAISGTLQERKGQHKLIEAIGMIDRKKYSIYLHIFGYNQFFPDYKKKCEQLIEEYNLCKYVIFEGFCDNMSEKLKEIDALVCASDWESFPQVVLEAMAMKIPIISTPVAGIPELIKNDVTGYLSTGFEVKDIKKSLNAFLEDYFFKYTKVIEILENAQNLCYRECNRYFVTKELFNLYNQAIKYMQSKISDNNNLEYIDNAKEFIQNCILEDKKEEDTLVKCNNSKEKKVPLFNANDDKYRKVKVKSNKYYSFIAAGDILKKIRIKCDEYKDKENILVNIYCSKNTKIPLRTIKSKILCDQNEKWIEIDFLKPIKEIYGEVIMMKFMGNTNLFDLQIYSNGEHIIGEAIYIIQD